MFSDSQLMNEEAAKELGVSVSTDAESPHEMHQALKNATQTPFNFKREDKILSNDAYKIYLVKKYPLEFNDILKKYIFKDKLFETLDDALAVVHKFELENGSTGNQTTKIQSFYSEKNGAISFLNLIGIDVRESLDGTFTVINKDLTELFNSDSEFLEYANKKATEWHSSN